MEAGGPVLLHRHRDLSQVGAVTYGKLKVTTHSHQVCLASWRFCVYLKCVLLSVSIESVVMDVPELRQTDRQTATRGQKTAGRPVFVLAGQQQHCRRRHRTSSAG